MKMKTIHMTIKPNDLHLRNELHFDVQRNTKCVVFRDKTKYTRKQKHKRSFLDD